MAPGIKPMPPALEAWSLNHWTTREASYGIPFSHSSLQPCFPSTCYCHCHDFHPWGPADQKDGRSPHSHACPCWPEVKWPKSRTHRASPIRAVACTMPRLIQRSRQDLPVANPPQVEGSKVTSHEREYSPLVDPSDPSLLV